MFRPKSFWPGLNHVSIINNIGLHRLDFKKADPMTRRLFLPGRGDPIKSEKAHERVQISVTIWHHRSYCRSTLELLGCIQNVENVSFVLV